MGEDRVPKTLGKQGEGGGRIEEKRKEREGEREREKEPAKKEKGRKARATTLPKTNKFMKTKHINIYVYICGYLEVSREYPV